MAAATSILSVPAALMNTTSRCVARSNMSAVTGMWPPGAERVQGVDLGQVAIQRGVDRRPADVVAAGGADAHGSLTLVERVDDLDVVGLREEPVGVGVQ